MYHKWIEWQEDAGLDSRIGALMERRKNALIEIVYLQYQFNRQFTEMCKTRAHLENAKSLHKEIDRQLAEIDGRLLIIPPKEERRKKQRTKYDINKLVNSLSTEELTDLITRLRVAGT